MNRRHFHRQMAACAALSLPAVVRAVGDVAPPNASNAAWSRGFVDVPERWGPARVAFDRQLPAGLRGTLWRNGPARMRRGATAYAHWFDGDGMVHAFDLEGDAMVHRARMVRTDRYRAEEAAGRFLHNGFGTAFPDALPSTRPDDTNVANISVLPIGSEVLALWEAGSPWRMDPSSLETLGRKVWSSDSDGLSFSAHPRVDPDGTVWNFGYLTGSGRLALWHLRRDGELARMRVIQAPNADMVHDFAVTATHLVFLLMPLLLDRQVPASAAFIDRLRWEGDRTSSLLLVDKATLAVTHRMELPPFAFFHLGNAWHEGDVLVLQAMAMGSMAATMAAVREATAGRPSSPVDSGLVELRADLRSGRVERHPTPLQGAEFPSWDPRRTGLRTRHLVSLAASPLLPVGAFGFDAVARYDRSSGRVERWDYGRSMVADEHLFVPRGGGAEGEGWILGTVHDLDRGRSLLNVFDAAALASGPIAIAALDHRLPPGLHGRFVQA